MVVKVRCDCGKTYQVPDDARGKRLKCPACGKAVTVPGPAAPAPAPPPLPRRTAARRQVVLPWKGIILAALLVGVVGGGWFGVVRPMRARSAIDAAMKPTEEARYKTAVDMLTAARSKAYGKYLAEIDFRIAQMELEMEMSLSGGSSPEGRLITLEALPRLAEKSTKLLLDVEFSNEAQEPIILHRQAFYLVNASGLAPAVSHTTDPIDGTLVQPGGTGKGVVAFWKLPGSPMGLITPEVGQLQRLVYNDGVRYRAAPFSLFGVVSSPIPSGVPFP
jgi:hypothetical protein